MWSTRPRPTGHSHLDRSNPREAIGNPAPGTTPIAGGRRVHLNEPGAKQALAGAICERLTHHPGGDPLVIVCVGSDRSTGDALGPLVGSRLAPAVHRGMAEVYGTLERPVHAANLAECLAKIGDDRTVIAVDACLGRAENVGTVCVKDGALEPGTGVNKSLPRVGHFHIVGVVNVGGFMEYFVLQNTRLNLVVRLADLIADGLLTALDRRAGGPGRPLVAASLDA